MISRRDLIATSAACAATARAPTFAATAAAPASDILDEVDVFIGTGGHGHTHPGATLPFGMVQLGPDTGDQGWDWCSGYHYNDPSIMGFSHTHLSGTGCADLLDVLVVPAAGPVRLQPGPRDGCGEGYRSRFDKASERARPGSYAVRLTDARVGVELTATARTGLHRYLFPPGEAGHLLVDLHHGARDWSGKDTETRVRNASLRVVGADTLLGSRRVFQWAQGRWIHFALKVSRPFSRADLYVDDRRQDGAEGVDGEALKAALHFQDAGAGPLMVKVGLSGVDIDGALRNLEAESPGFDFDGARAAAEAAWRQALGCVALEGPAPDRRKAFYTALYHSLLAPTRFTDVDGRARGLDGRVRGRERGAASYSTYSIWDIYRALVPLLSLVQPVQARALAADLALSAQESPQGPPVWPLQGIETGTMIGWHSSTILAEAHVKGVGGVDYRGAWSAFRRIAFDSDVLGLPDYRRLGFIPSDKVPEAASRTLEYAYDDWCMAALAEAAGATQDAGLLRARSRNYRNLFDPKLQFMRPRLADGGWAEPFDPIDLGHDRKRWNDFTECNAWQATFLNQHDVYGAMALFGGAEPFEAKLDALFSAPSTLPPDAPPDIAGLVGQYAHGNEPSHHVAWLYAYLGAHHKTQARVRMLCETFYPAAPDGLAGNEDCGQMSAWLVLAMLGVYMVDPASGVWVLGAPQVERARLELGEGRRLEIVARGACAGRPFVQSARWRGAPLARTWLSHAEIASGGTLSFEMGARPNPTYGADPAIRPPSFRVMGAA